MTYQYCPAQTIGLFASEMIHNLLLDIEDRHLGSNCVVARIASKFTRDEALDASLYSCVNKLRLVLQCRRPHK